MSKSFVPVPGLPGPPRSMDEVLDWCRETRKALVDYFGRVGDFIPDYRLFGRVTRQNVADGFIIKPTGYYIELTASANATSDGTTAIENGEDGQTLIIENISNYRITIQETTNTFFSGRSSETLQFRSTLMVRWDGTGWVEIAHSDN